MLRRISLAIGVIAAMAFSGTASAGPVILMGIDAEDGGVGAHGPISVYDSVVSSLIGNVSNGGSGILVVGGGKGLDHVTSFWTQISADTGNGVTFVNGAAGISAASLAGFAAVAVVSSELETPIGGLTDAENSALSARQGDIAAFVNGGGGLLGFSSVGLTTPYGYVTGLGGFAFSFFSYSDITPTLDGLAVGITNALDVCCWHDTFTAFPGFLNVLATTTGASPQAAAIGGLTVFIPPDDDVPEPTSLLLFGVGLAGIGFLRRRRKSA